MFGSMRRTEDIQTSIKKACTPEDTAPKRKHVRACIVYTWERKSSKEFWESMKVLPLKENDVALFKALTLIHKVLQEGHPSCLIGGFKNMDWIASLGHTQSPDRRYQILIPEYVDYLLQKLRFHHNHRGFNGTFEYEEYTSLRSVSDPNEGFDAVYDLQLLQEALDHLGRDTLAPAKKNISEAITSALVPIVSETYGIYKFLISMLRGLYRSSDSVEALEPLRAKFDEQHDRLYDFYAQCTAVRYLSTLITIPKLPFDAPTLADEQKSVSPLIEQGIVQTPADYANVQKAVSSQPTGAVANAHMAGQQAYEAQQQQLEQQRQQQLQQQQQELEQQRLYWEEQQKRNSEAQQLAQQQLLLDQAQRQAQGRVAELERDILALKGQYDSDQLMLRSYDEKLQVLETELRTTSETAGEQLAAKEQQLTFLQEQIDYWKNKYESLAKLYSQLRAEHLDLLAKSKKIQQKAASAQEAVERRERMEREMKAKNVELADLIKERDRAKLELERVKTGSKGQFESLQLAKDELEQKLATLERAQSANLTAVFNQHKNEVEQLQQKLARSSLADGSSGKELEVLREKLQEKDMELEMMQQTMDETIKGLVAQQKEAGGEGGHGGLRKVSELIDAVLKSGIDRIQDGVFELDSAMQAGNVNSSPEYLSSVIEKTSGLATEFASSFNSFLVDGAEGDAGAVIGGVTNFTTSIGDVLLGTKGLARLAKVDELQEDLIDTARDVAEISEVYLESLFERNLGGLGLEEKTEAVINGNIDVQEMLQTLTSLVESLRTPSSRVDLEKVSGELSEVVDKEMAHASRVIDEASSHLISLLEHPSMSSVDVEVSKSILAAASAIITAIKYLIEASIEAQQEIVNNGRGSSSRTSFYKKNNKWTEGLISAAKSIASTTNTLIGIADGVLQNKHSDEELIVASREVAASTAQLVSAARVKSQFMSKTQDKLEEASKKVNLACKQLVIQVNQLISSKNELDEVDYSKLSIHETKTAEMEQQVEILKLENALNSARKRLGEIRKFSYRDDE
ncbi:hypothetical protein PICMEDRAFT_16315 [Pichia membranifaciens NRRL Y-2026]|uniref:I/LWEQ domain-containing protein n=1 Tax=Pichia membranifaciens NRRL Y-2026 TaxID=763406 RepID=A0A1E3NJY9_9ASCO|nr:hypothetical protein PICMEDRAFT_16315 [Pichia membranifaciens NRRL Y-2026]ODQ46431.1 hypothetical protein PICMEDRAFT_16315 [Pichia membranifaciens NRRL Y-2026]